MTAPIQAGSTGATVAANPLLATGDNTQLSSKAFLQLLVAQLQYQDPSKPVDTASFMNETATLSQVQASEQNAEVQTDLLAAQKAQTASSMVGHTVVYAAADGTQKTGVVSSATISSANPTLKIGTETVAMASVQQILASGTTS